jgi:hypothetical protein
MSTTAASWMVRGLTVTYAWCSARHTQTLIGIRIINYKYESTIPHIPPFIIDFKTSSEKIACMFGLFIGLAICMYQHSHDVLYIARSDTARLHVFHDSNRVVYLKESTLDQKYSVFCGTQYIPLSPQDETAIIGRFNNDELVDRIITTYCSQSAALTSHSSHLLETLDLEPIRFLDSLETFTSTSLSSLLHLATSEVYESFDSPRFIIDTITDPIPRGRLGLWDVRCELDPTQLGSANYFSFSVTFDPRGPGNATNDVI